MIPSFPSTRYQGSKRRHLEWMHGVLSGASFATALDAFGGTGAVTHLLSAMGATVQYNDVLPANAAIAGALFALQPVTLDEAGIVALFRRDANRHYPDHIGRVYDGIYYTPEENSQLDTLAVNIPGLNDPQQQLDAWYCLFQAALSKRPYNLFHRANLAMRQRTISRNFGNKTAWDKSFVDHMLKFRNELVAYRGSCSRNVRVTCEDAFNLDARPDLVYIDTPYARSNGSRETNYFNFYHFLDCLLDYNRFTGKLHTRYAHRPLYAPTTPWHPCDTLDHAFVALFARFPDSQLAVAYRSDGHPTAEQLVGLLRDTGRKVTTHVQAPRTYTLSTNRSSELILLAGTSLPQAYAPPTKDGHDRGGINT